MSSSKPTPSKWKDKLDGYRSEIRAAQSKLQQENRHKKWKGWRRIYAENDTTNDPNINAVSVPIAFANINVLRSALTVHNAKFTISPRNAASREAAMICEQMINYEWYHQDHQDEIRAAVDDMLIIGHGWVKLRYNLQIHTPKDLKDGETLPGFERIQGRTFSSAPFEVSGYSSEFDELVGSAMAVGGSNPSHMRESLSSRKELARQVYETGGVVLADHPQMDRVSPFDMYVDPSATRLKNAQWIAQRVQIRKDKVDKVKEWDKAITSQLHAGQKSITQDAEGDGKWIGFDPDSPSKTDGGSQMEWVVYWELYDLAEGTWCQFDENADDFLTRPEPMPYEMGHPFRLVTDYDVPDQFYPIGEIERIAPLQMELNKARTQLVNDREQTKSKWVVDKKLMADTTNQGLKHVLTSTQDNLIAAIDMQPQTDMSRSIFQIPARVLDPELYNVSATIRQDMDNISGVTDYQRGGGSTGASTATEAAIVNDGALARLKEKQNKVEKFMQETARGIVQLKLQFMQAEKTIRVIMGNDPGGVQGQMEELTGITHQGIREMYISYKKEDIRGEFDLIVQPGSSSAFNETQRRRQANELFASMVPLFGQGLVNEKAITEYYLRYGHGIPNADQFMLAAEEPQGPQGGEAYDPTGQGLGGVPTQSGGQLAPGGGIPEAAIAPPPDLAA